MPHTKARLNQILHASAAVRAEIDAEIERVLNERQQAIAGPDTGNQPPYGRNQQTGIGQRAG